MKNRKIHRIAAGIVNPYFGLNSLIFGTKIPATSKSEIPISGQLFMRSNHPFNLWIPEMKGTSAIIELQLEYGSLLDRNVSSFTPFDYSTLRPWINIPSWEESRAAYFNLSLHAIIYGKKLTNRRHQMDLISISKHYDFIQNDLFKLGSIVLTGDYWVQRNLDNIRVVASAKAGFVIFGNGNSEMVPNMYPDIFPEFDRDYI